MGRNITVDPVVIAVGVLLGGAWLYQRFYEARQEARSERRLRVRAELRNNAPIAVLDDVRFEWEPFSGVHPGADRHEGSHHFSKVAVPRSRYGVFGVEGGRESWMWSFYLGDAWDTGARAIETGTATSELAAQQAAEAWYFAADAQGFFRN